MVKKQRGTTSILIRETLRTFLRSKLQFVACILITALAMTLFVGLASNSLSLSNRVNELYQGSNVADIWTTVTREEERDLRAIEKAVGSDGVIEKRLQISSELNGYNANALISNKIPTISKPYLCDNTIQDDFFIVDKRLLEDVKVNKTTPFIFDGEYQTVPVSFAFSLYQDVFRRTKISDMVPLIESDLSVIELLDLCVKDGGKNIFNEPFLNMEFKVTGTMMFAENIESSIVNSGSFLLSRSLFLKQLEILFNNNFVKPTIFDSSDEDYIVSLALNFGLFEIIENTFYSVFETNNQYLAKVGKGVNIERAKNEITEHFNAKEENNLLMCVDINHLASNITIQNDIVQAEQLSFIFPMIFFLVAILVVLTTITQLIVKDRIQIGTLKALGISKSRIIIHYMILSLLIVLCGIIFGVGVGPLLLPYIMNIKYNILYSLPQITYTISIFHAIISTLCVFAATALVTFLVIRKDANLVPAMSMRPKVVKSLKPTKKTTKSKNASTLSVKMAFRNIRLNIVKSIMVVFGVIGCTALLVCGFGIDDTLNYGVKKDLGSFYNADITVSYDSISSLASSLSSIEGIESFEEYANLPANISNDITNYQTIAYLVNDDSKFIKFDNYSLKNEVVLSKKIAEAIGTKIGDEINFNILGNNYTATVGHIHEIFFLHGIYINVDVLQLSAVMDMKNNAFINIKDGTNIDSLEKEIEGISGVANVRSKSENEEVINGYMSSLSVMTLAVKIFAILLAVVVLYNFAIMNYKERSRDIATMKVLGFSTLEISYSLIIETLLLTIAGIFVGLIFGLPVEMLVLGVNETPLVEFLYTIYPLTYVFSFLITFGTAFIVNLYLSRKVRKVRMVESLKSIE